MTDELIYRLIALAVLVAAFSISGYFRRKADRQNNPLRTSEGSGLVVVLRLMGLVFFLPLLGYLVNPEWVRWAMIPLPGWAHLVGAAISISCVPFVYWTLSSLGNSVSPTQGTRENHVLVTHGPYQWIRHPLYTFGALAWVGLALLTGLWWMIIGFVPLTLLLWRAKSEEANLVETFGDAYRTYQARTKRFIPFVY
jgi:protein-S-isoprenylcysteine O-methyltransferase Ste14